MLPDSTVWAATCIASLVAVSISDALYRRIPNAMSGLVWLIGCSYWCMHAGMAGVWLAFEGTVVGGSILLVLYAFGMVGAGDVKVFMGFGAWLGPTGALWAALYGLLVGGVLSLVIIWEYGVSFQQLRRGFHREALGNALAIARQRGTTVPLAAALSVGVLLATAGFP